MHCLGEYVEETRDAADEVVDEGHDSRKGSGSVAGRVFG